MPDEAPNEDLTAEEAADWSEMWNKAGGKERPEAAEEPEASDSETPADAPTEAEASAPTPEGDPPGSASHDERVEALRKTAEELGLAFDGAQVTLSERKEFRDAKRRHQEWVKARETQANETIGAAERKAAEIVAAAQERVSRADELVKGLTTYDYDGLAKAAGFADWNALQEDVFSRQSDPNYKRLKALEREAQERTSRETKEREEYEKATKRAQAEQQERERKLQEQKHVQEYRSRLSAALKESDNALYRAFHDEPSFLNAIISVQRAHFDEETRSSVTVEQAIHMPLPGTNTSIIGILKQMNNRYRAAFTGEADPPGAAPPPATPSSKKKPPPKSMVTNGKNGVSRPVAKPHRRWIEDASRQLQEAMNQDEAEERKVFG